MTDDDYGDSEIFHAGYMLKGLGEKLMDKKTTLEDLADFRMFRVLLTIVPKLDEQVER